MEKYKIGETLVDKEYSDIFYKILAVAPKLDFQDVQYYFVEVWDKGSTYYSAYDHVFLNTYAEKNDEGNDSLEFIE